MHKSYHQKHCFYVNDFGIILNKYGRFDLYQIKIQPLLAAGGPIDVIGIQSHNHGEGYSV